MRTGAGFTSGTSSPASPSPAAATPYAQHNAYQSPVPYLFAGVAAMLGLIAFALLILACSYWRLSGYLNGGDADPDRRTSGAEKQACAGPMPPPCFGGGFVVIMPGDEKPTFLATPISSGAASFGDGGKDAAAAATAEGAGLTRAAVTRTENSEE